MNARELVPALGADEAERNQRELVFDDVYRTQADFVWRVLRRHGIAPDVAEDLVHEVFLVIHRRLADYDGRASVRGWVYMLTRGVMSNERRKIARARGHAASIPRPRAMPDPEEQARHGEAADLIRGFLETLDPRPLNVSEVMA